MTHLTECGAIDKLPAKRSETGTFAANRFRLKVETEEVAKLVAYFRSSLTALGESHTDNGRAEDFAEPNGDLPDGTYIKERAHARATSIPLFNSYEFHDASHRNAAEEILDAAGPGLADPLADEAIPLSLFKILPSWLKEFDLRLHIIPLVVRRTKKARLKNGNPNSLEDFTLLTPDLRKYRASLERAERCSTTSSPGRRVPAKSISKFPLADSTRESKAQALRNAIAGLKQGHQPRSLLPPAHRNLSGSELDRAFEELLAALQIQLSELEQSDD